MCEQRESALGCRTLRSCHCGSGGRWFESTQLYQNNNMLRILVYFHILRAENPGQASGIKRRCAHTVHTYRHAPVIGGCRCAEFRIPTCGDRILVLGSDNAGDPRHAGPGSLSAAKTVAPASRKRVRVTKSRSSALSCSVIRVERSWNPMTCCERRLPDGLRLRI